MKKNITGFILKVLFKADFIGFVLLNCLNIISCIVPLLCSKLISDIVTLFTSFDEKNKDKIFEITVIYICLSVLLLIITPVKEYFHQRFKDKVAAESELMLYEKINQFKDIACYEDSDFYNKLLLAKDGSGARFISVTDMFSTILNGFITVILTSYYLVNVQWKIALVALLSIVPGTMYNFWSARNRLALFRTQSEPSRKLQYYGDLFVQPTYAKEMRLFDLGTYIIKKYQMLFKTEFSRINKSRRKYTAIGVICTAFSGVISGLALFMYISQSFSKQIEAGSIVLYISLLPQFINGLRAIINGIVQTKANNNYVKHFFDFLNLEVQLNNNISLQKKIKSISFNDVSFIYPNSNNYSLKNVSFTCKSPSLIAVVGENGSGKSTLIKLLLNLFSPNEGEISINGQSLTDLDIVEYRKHISGVFQSPAKFSFSVNENVRLADTDVMYSQEDIVNACKKANADSFIKKLPNSYKSILGKQFQGGTEISDGQWQKLSLARAMCSNAEVLIFDEASADLDPESEYYFYKSIKQFAKDKITFYITHRLSGTKDADLILVMDNGNLIEQGTHSELMKSDGKYKKLYDMQAEGYEV